jgi:hypothetical protein
MQVHVPEELGGSLRVLPEDTYDAVIQDMFLGVSKTGNPKLTVKWLVQSEYTGEKDEDYISTVGENVLETYSLQPQALWNLNDLYKSVTGDRLPQGDYDEEEFLEMLKNALLGASMKIRLITDDNRSVVEERISN